MNRTVLSALAAAALVAGCEKQGGTVSAIEAAWVEAGLAPEGWEEAKLGGLGEASCRQGTIKGIEVVLCRYDSADAAKAAQPAGRALIGKTTGTALAADEFLLVISDRDQADPHGKTINLIAKRFQATATAGGDDGAKAAAKGEAAADEELPSWAKSAGE